MIIPVASVSTWVKLNGSVVQCPKFDPKKEEFSEGENLNLAAMITAWWKKNMSFLPRKICSPVGVIESSSLVGLKNPN